ncbi:glycosyl transferase family 2 [Halobacteriales archaeon QS_4_69_225]|nr:MAG: glycosyl transferase family 2 [Halobacteriales archaeon QS_4_69_225]
MPTVSVIIPTYDRAPVLGRAIDSVLAQTHTDLEVVVVDDASTDETAAVVERRRDPRLERVAHDENRGASAARNTGIEHATGEYVAFLDSDDEWRPRKLERQLERLEDRGDDDEWVAAYCDAEWTHDGLLGQLEVAVAGLLRDAGSAGSAESAEPVEGGEELVADVLLDDLHTHAGSALLVERAVAERLGGFDESFDRFEDAEFLVRVLRQGKLAHVPEPLVVRHESDDPAADTVEAADEHYLETFADTVAALEAAGHDVEGRHALILAKVRLRDGDLRAGLAHLRRAAVTPRQVPGVGWAAVRGQAAPAAALGGLIALGAAGVTLRRGR